MNLNTARVFVRDIHRAKAFYGQVLGLRLRADGAAQGHLVFDAGNCELVVEAVPADAPADEQARVGRYTGLSFRVDDVHASHRTLTARGVSFRGLPQRQSWGGTLATLRDPEGNELQIVQRPAA